MKHLKRLGLAAVAAMALMAFVGAGTASATTLIGVGGSVLKAGTTIHAVNVGTVTFTTEVKNVECTGSTIQGTTSNETGTTVNITVSTLTFTGCNCEVKVLKTGTLSIERIGTTSNGTVKSNGAEITESCSTIFGTVHCIVATSGTDLGTLTGGTTATIDISSAQIPYLTTSSLCSAGRWDATYKIDNPDTLNVIG